MANQESWKELFQESDEMRFDNRLVEKKLEEGFLTEEEYKKFKSATSEETEFDFSAGDKVVGAASQPDEELHRDQNFQDAPESASPQNTETSA